jgi:hypothetical protein
MTTLHKSVVNVLTGKFDANVVRNIGSKASEALLGIDTIKGLALTLGEMLVEPSQYKTPKALPVVMYQPLAEGIAFQYSSKKGDVEKYFTKQGENWLISTFVEFEKFKGEKHHASVAWLMATDLGKYEKANPAKAQITAIMKPVKTALIKNSVNKTITRMLAVFKPETEPKAPVLDLAKVAKNAIDKAELIDNENPVLLTKLFEKLIAEYNLRRDNGKMATE